MSFSYTMFVVLLQRYPASSLQAFTFLTPVWGVLLGGLLLGESITWAVALGMALVAGGVFLVNRQMRPAPRPGEAEPEIAAAERSD